MYCGFIELMAETPERAEPELLRAYTVLSDIGEHHRLPTLAAVLARVAYAQGRDEDAGRSGDGAPKRPLRTTSCHRSCGVERGRRCSPAPGSAARRWRWPTPRSQPRGATDFLLLRADVMADHSEVKLALGDERAALIDLDDAIALYDQKGVRSRVRRLQEARTSRRLTGRI